MSNNARMPNEVVNPFRCSHIVLIALHSAKEEYLGTLCAGCSNSITNACDNRHGLPRLISEHDGVSGLPYPGFPRMQQEAGVIFDVDTPISPVVFYYAGEKILSDIDDNSWGPGLDVFPGEEIMPSHVPVKLPILEMLLADVAAVRFGPTLFYDVMLAHVHSKLVYSHYTVATVTVCVCSFAFVCLFGNMGIAPTFCHILSHHVL